MTMLSFTLLVSIVLGLVYAGFAIGVRCASDRNLRLLAVRTLALLGVTATGGIVVTTMHAEQPVDDAVAEVMSRYTDLSELMAVEPQAAEAASEEVVEVELEVEELVDDQPEPVVISCRGLHQDFDPNDPHSTELVSYMPEVPVRPDWLDQPLQTEGSGDHFASVSSGPWITDVEAQGELDKAIYETVATYVDDQVGRRGAARRIGLSLGEIRDRDMIVDAYTEDRQFSVGHMKIHHAHVQFSPEFRTEIGERWREHLVATRLVKTSVSVAVVMGLLFVAFGVLKRLGGSPQR